MREGDFSDISPHLLGDMLSISVDTAEREARAADMDPEKRFLELLIHGILHLLGYDHETDEEEALRMEEKTRELMRLVGGF